MTHTPRRAAFRIPRLRITPVFSAVGPMLSATWAQQPGPCTRSGSPYNTERRASRAGEALARELSN
ncbi:hypothetical protein [Acetobacter lambici]|uniref:hypothetical protein n=1 Tax=Acetobacter lambici TaxID=1332824 RepID=UPI0020A2C656|nr:hypothetical protein [Acetobacter lambici]MCP1241189.1 hypothetical protein [Acetobacter lambici]